jgi:protein-L-isoaspartate(D-aspartate) O-methyltransferase
MGAQGQETIGGLCKSWLAEQAFLVGFGTDRGTVAAASDWGAPLEIKSLVPARSGSYEAICHEAGVPGFILQLRDPVREEVRDELEEPRLERAVGVIYRPETELQSHYFQASLPHQFDAYIWFDETKAVEPLRGAPTAPGLFDTYPFGL